VHAVEGTRSSKEPESGTVQNETLPTVTGTVYCVLRKFRAVKHVCISTPKGLKGVADWYHQPTERAPLGE